MRNFVVPFIILFSLVAGVWLGYGLGVDHQYRRDYVFVASNIAAYHQSLVEEGVDPQGFLREMAKQADKLDRSADSSFDLDHLNLIGLFERSRRTAFDEMRSYTDDYLRSIGVRKDLAQAN